MKYFIMLLILSACATLPPGFSSEADYIRYLETSNRSLENKYLFQAIKLERAQQDLAKEKDKVSKVKDVIKKDLKNLVSESMDKKEVK